MPTQLEYAQHTWMRVKKQLTQTKFSGLEQIIRVVVDAAEIHLPLFQGLPLGCEIMVDIPRIKSHV